MNAAFQRQYLARDVQAGIITGAMAVPLSIGIAIMSDYPIKVGLATVALASFIGWFYAWFRPGNYIGSPGIAAGLAPILAMGVATFGMENMAFIVLLTSIFQAIIWKFNWQRYLLIAVPTYLVEGLLAGIGLKIADKFITFTYEVPEPLIDADNWFNESRMNILGLSLVCGGLFLYLFNRFKGSQPAIPYFAILIIGVLSAQFVPVSMLQVEDVDITWSLPVPHFDNWMLWLYAIGFSLLLATVDVIEQVMSNAAIEKIDPLKRKCNSNNSLLSIWSSNMASSFFGGMTNLDGLAKSTTNRLAGAYTKFSVLIIGSVVTFFVLNIEYLDYIPKYVLGIIMLFTAWKMIAGLLHVANHGEYALLLSVLCAILVYKVGIFEGLLAVLFIHAIIHYFIFVHVEKNNTQEVIRGYMRRFTNQSNDGLM